MHFLGYFTYFRSFDEELGFVGVSHWGMVLTTFYTESCEFIL